MYTTKVGVAPRRLSDRVRATDLQQQSTSCAKDKQAVKSSGQIRQNPLKTRRQSSNIPYIKKMKAPAPTLPTGIETVLTKENYNLTQTKASLRCTLERRLTIQYPGMWK